MHPEINYRHRQAPPRGADQRPPRHAAARARRGIRGFFRRRRDLPVAVDVQPASIVLLPPPREEREPAGHDQRVA